LHKLGKLSSLTLFSFAAAFAGPVPTLFQGTFAADNQIEVFQLTLASAGVPTIESFGYAGGTVNATVIPAGGFWPEITLFDSLGMEFNSIAGGACGSTPALADPVTGNCSDPYFNGPLAAGTYTAVLSVSTNDSVDGILADGFIQSGNPGFTCQFNPGGQFCDLSDALNRSRTGNWALAFAGFDSVVDTSVVPEPSTWWLLLSGALLMALPSRRKSF
jgi:hypothetical protein